MNRNKLIALARHLECKLDDLCESLPGSRDGDVVEYGRQEWLVLTDAEADAKAKEYIEESVWAFNPSFLSRYIPGSERAIRVVQEKCSDDCNDLLRAAIGDRFQEFVNDAISSDSRGHFLSSYDSEEVEITVPVGRNRQQMFFAYRKN